MKTSEIRLLAIDTLRELAENDREPALLLVVPAGVGDWKGRSTMLGKVNNLRNLFHSDKLAVEQVSECAYSILRDSRPENNAGKGRKNHLKISREAWNKLLKLRKGDITAFLHEFQNRRLHRVHAQAA